MKQTVNFSQFYDAFADHNRQDQFTYDGLRALYDYLEEYEEGTGEEVELDVIALCCEFTEYEGIEELQGSYPDITDIDHLHNYTTVIMVDTDSFIIQDF